MQSIKKSSHLSSAQHRHKEPPRQIQPLHKSLYTQLYLSMIPKLNEQVISQKEKLLESKSFIKTNNNYHHFQTDIIKIKENSVMYQVHYGCYKTNISVFTGRIELPGCKRQKIGSGGQSDVYLLQSDNQYIAAKSHKIVEKNFGAEDNHLKEVFMSKFASVLGIGPYFYSGYGYDLIKLNNRIEFAMEYCPRQKQKLLNENKDQRRENLLKNLSILHYFHGIHYDVKPDNIGWSSQQQKYVLLDFGYSCFIDQSIGFQSLTSFKGTFHYSCKQMKKAYILQDNQYVDLYYNDLFGAKLSFIDIPTFLKEIKGKEFEDEATELKIDPIIRFFKLSFSIFIEDDEEIYSLIQSQKLLLMSFRKTIQLNITEQSYLSKYIKCLDQQCKILYGNKIYDEILDMETLDSLLYKQLSRQKCKISNDLQVNNKNIISIFLMNKLQEIWGEPVWTQSIFDLLFEYKRKLKTNQVNMIDFIATNLGRKPQTDNFSQACISTLRVFEDFFISRNNIQYLIKIRNIYIVTKWIAKEKDINCSIWKIIAEIDNQVTYMIGLYNDLSISLAYLSYNVKWIFYPNGLHHQYSRPIFRMCFAILLSCNYFEDEINSFQKLQRLIQELGLLITEPTARNIYQKAMKLLIYFKERSDKMKPLDLKQAYDTNKCFLLENDNYKGILHDTALPTEIQRYLEKQASARFALLWGVQGQRIQKYLKIEKKYLYQHSFLSEIQIIDKFLFYLVQDNQEKAKYLLETYLSENKSYCFYAFQIFMRKFFRSMISTLPESYESFKILIEYVEQMGESINSVQMINFLQDISICSLHLIWGWEIFKVKQMIFTYFLKFAPVVLSFLKNCHSSLAFQDLPKKSKKQFKLIHNILKVANRILIQNEIQVNNKEQETIQERKLLMMSVSQLHQSYQLHNCWVFVYQLISLIIPYLSLDFQLQFNKEVFQYFYRLQTQTKVLLFKSNKLITSQIEKYFVIQKKYHEFFDYVLNLNRLMKNIYKDLRSVKEIIDKFPKQLLASLITTKMVKEPLIMIDSRVILFWMADIFIECIAKELPFEVQCRIIRMLSHGNERNHLKKNQKKKVKIDILKWQHFNKVSYPPRTRFINRKIYIKLEQNNFITYRQAIISRIKSLGNKLMASMMKQMLKRDYKRMQKMEVEYDRQILQKILDSGTHTNPIKLSMSFDI